MRETKSQETQRKERGRRERVAWRLAGKQCHLLILVTADRMQGGHGREENLYEGGYLKDSNLYEITRRSSIVHQLFFFVCFYKNKFERRH